MNHEITERNVVICYDINGVAFAKFVGSIKLCQ